MLLEPYVQGSLSQLCGCAAGFMPARRMASEASMLGADTFLGRLARIAGWVLL